MLTSPAQQDRYIATAQLGITLASLGLGMYGEHTLARSARAVARLGLPFVGAAPLATHRRSAMLTLAHIFFGEMVPKGLALQHPERVARFTDWPMRSTLSCSTRLCSCSNGSANCACAWSASARQENTHEQVYTPEELQLIVEESERAARLRAESGRLLRELFEFGDLTAGQVMVPRVRVVGIPVGATPDAVRAHASPRTATRATPVYDGDLDHIVGMLHVKDLLRRLMQRRADYAADVRRMPVVPETASLDDVLTTMQRAHAHMAVVIDEHGGTAGHRQPRRSLRRSRRRDRRRRAGGAVARRRCATVRCARPARSGSTSSASTSISISNTRTSTASAVWCSRGSGRPPVVGDVVEYGPSGSRSPRRRDAACTRTCRASLLDRRRRDADAERA